MAVPNKRGPLLLVMIVLTFSAIGVSARADEIRLKGGKKLYGVIVAYEDNMFKVKTDYGYELVEKDKIESIIPSTPAGKPEAVSALEEIGKGAAASGSATLKAAVKESLQAISSSDQAPPETRRRAAKAVDALSKSP